MPLIRSLFVHVFAFILAVGPLKAQELWFLAPQHDVSFETEADLPSLKPWTVRSLQAGDLSALLDQGVLELALVGSPQDPRLQARAENLQAELRRIGFLGEGAEASRLTDANLRSDRMKLGLRLRNPETGCPGWTLEVEMRDLFGDQLLRLPALESLPLPGAARIRAVPAESSGGTGKAIGPFSSPAELELFDHGGHLWEGAGRGPGNNVDAPILSPRPPHPAPSETEGAPQGQSACRLIIGTLSPG